MSKFLSEKYKGFDSYVPGEQPQDKKYIKLNTNESPYPPSEKVLNAVNKSEVADLRLYSDPECKVLREKIANLYGVGKDNVYLSNGSDDILNFAFMAFGEKGVVFPEISYGFYKVFAELYGIEFEAIPLREDFSICPSDYYGKNKLIVIANPNAPTGLVLSVSEIRKILDTNPESVVVIDEAYIDFGGESCCKLIKEYKNLLVVQTFSKSRSMAGARLGFCFADKEIIDDLNKIKYSTNPYNINRLTLVAGAAAIDDNDYFMANCQKIINTRTYTTEKLTELGFKVINSYANFVFAESDKISGAELYEKLKDNGVLVRHFTGEKVKNFNRITIGTMEEMTEFIKITSKILEEKL